MATSHSPLRYPGGKQVLSRVLAHLIAKNGLEGGTYAEPYAGGAGAALTLLFGEHVHRIMINDADIRIHAFWSSILNKTDKFLKLLQDTPLTVAQWQIQRGIYRRAREHDRLAVGFATFYLNRCNRSGIIDNAGLIGGLRQTGLWKLDARFNRAELAKRIHRICRYKSRIALSNLDAIEFLKTLEEEPPTKADRVFVYLDPPYYAKGSQLYLNHYQPADHAALASYLSRDLPYTWVLSYDNVPQIRRLYRRKFKTTTFDLGYSAHRRRTGSELLIYPAHLAFPRPWRSRINDVYISAADSISMPMPA
jgi:DNA adenine methylase